MFDRSFRRCDVPELHEKQGTRKIGALPEGAAPYRKRCAALSKKARVRIPRPDQPTAHHRG
jgi:hypothetical protein